MACDGDKLARLCGDFVENAKSRPRTLVDVSAWQPDRVILLKAKILAYELDWERKAGGKRPPPSFPDIDNVKRKDSNPFYVYVPHVLFQEFEELRGMVPSADIEVKFKSEEDES